MEGLGEELREMAKNLKVRVHINPKFLPILADRAAIAGGSASVASLLQGRMDDLDQVQGANHETLSVQKLWQGNDPGKDGKLDTGLEKEASRKRIPPVSKHLPRSESETEGRTSLTSDSRSSGLAGRAAEGQFGQGCNSDGKDNLIRVKVDPENRASELNQDRQKQNELRYEMERDETEQLIAEVVRGTSSSGIPLEPTFTDGQKAMVQGSEEILLQGDFSPEFLVSIKQERHSAHEGSSDGSVVTGKSRSSVPVDGNRVFAVSGPVTSDLTGVDQGQGLETEGSGKGGIMRDSSAYLRKQDKQKLKEEVLLLEKMVAEKKALQVERENRERNGGKSASKEKLQQRTVATDDRETRKSQHKSATSTTERLQRRLLLEEKQRAAVTMTDRLRRHGIDERHRLGSDDRSMGPLSEWQTSSVSIAPSGENKLRRDTGYDNQESNQVSDNQVKPASLPCVVEEKLRKPMTSDYKEIALKSDSQEKQQIEDQSPKGEIMAAHESVLKERPKKKKGWPERQEMPALFPAFQNSNILQSKDKVPAVSNDFEQPLRNSGASQEHHRLTCPKTSTPKFSKESEEQKWEDQKHVFQSPQHNMEVRDAGNIGLARTPVEVTDPAMCSCVSQKGKKMTIEHCEYCLRRQLLGNGGSIMESSSAPPDFAEFASPKSLMPSTGLQHEAVSNNVQGELVSDVDGIPPMKNSTDGESLDSADNAPSHLSCLCPETQFESQFYDCTSVRRIHLEATREWMSQKPLEMLICGRLKELPRLLPWLPPDFNNDPLIMNCLTSFSQSMNEILEQITAQEDMTGSDAEVPSSESVAAEPPCATEQLANSLFEEVRQHLEFLSEKSLLQNIEVTGQPSDPAESEVYVEAVTPRVRGPEVMQPIPVLKKPSRYSTANNTGIETKTAHCDVSLSEVLPCHIRPHSSPQQVVRDEDKNSCHGQQSYVEDVDISQAQLPTEDVVHETKIQESTLTHNYKSCCRIPHSTGGERLRERSSADVPRIPKSHETEHSWRRGVARGRDILLRRRGFDSERNFYQNRGRDAVEGPRNESIRLTENQYRMKPSLHDSHKRRKHSRSQGDEKNDPKALAAAGKVEDHEPKRCRKEKVKELGRDLESEDDTLEEKLGKKLEKIESLEKKLEKPEPSKELDSSEVKDLRKGTKKAKKNKKERQDGDSSKKVKEKKEKKKVKKKKKTEAEKVSDQLLLEKPADTKVALSHLLSDAAESAFAQANTDSGSAFPQLNDDLRKDEKDPTSAELVETQAALDFRNLFKCPSDVKTPPVDLARSSPPLMQCFLDKNIDYTDVMQKLADVIPGTGNFDAKRLTPQTSFIWALALAVFKDEGKASEDIQGSAKLTEDFKQDLFDEECHDFVDAYEVGEDKHTGVDSYQSLYAEAAESGDKTSAQKSPGTRGSNLMQAFRQVVEAKRRAQELTKAKLALPKLSPELAAKRAAPKAAKPLFKPPTAFDPITILSNSGSDRFMARPEVLHSTDKYLAENLARDAFIKVCSELEVVLEEYCGLNNLERTVPPPLKFYLMYTHFAPLSLVAISLYKSVVSAMDEEKLVADQKISGDVECASESSLGSALNTLKRKRTDSDFMVCALLKKPREQTYSILNKEDEEILLANLTAKGVALGNNAKVVPSSTKSICLPNEGTTKEKSYLCPQDFYLHEYLPASDDCEGLNSLTDESESPPNVGNNFVKESDNTSGSAVPSTNAEMPCLTAVTDNSHQRFLNAKGPRFMQTFRQNQIAKRRSQKENLRTATGGKLLHSKQMLTVGVVKPKPIGMTLEETLAVLSGHPSSTSNTSSTVTPSTSGISVLSTDVSTALSRDVSTEVVPTNATNKSPPPKVSSEDPLPIETVTTSRSPTALPLQDLTTIPLPPSALPEDSFDAMDLGSPSESPVTVELGTSFSVSAMTVPYVTQPISCSTSFSSSFLISSSSDCYSGYEVSCAPPSGHLTSYLLPTPPAQTEDTQLEDSTTAAMNIQPPYSVSSAADTNQMMNSDWQYEYFPPPVDPPPVSYPSMSAEQPIQQSCMMPPHFASPRPYLLETPPDIQPGPYPCMPNELPPRYPHPCPDQRAWDNNPRPPPQPFPHPHPPQGLPWRGGRPPPPMNVMMPPDGGRLRFRPPPPGVNTNSPIMGPKRPLLLRPPSSSPGRGGLLPHPGCMPPPFATGFRERSASDPGISKEDGQQQPMTSATDIRMYIFNKDKAICKSIQVGSLLMNSL